VDTGIELPKLPVTGGDFATGALASSTNTAARNAVVVQAWRDQAHATGRKSTLVFAVDVAHVRALEVCEG
jgi:hypothetical protein